MTAKLCPPAASVPDALAAQAGEVNFEAWVEALIRERGRFGITRIGSITGLDRVGLPVAQVTRPLALTNAVSQGKGLTWHQAAASGLMEAIEGFAAESIPVSCVTQASAGSLGPHIPALYGGWFTDDAPAEWEDVALDWIEGWDLFSAAPVPVPLAFVDTVYTLPSPHPRAFPRVTTGLAGGRSLRQAVVNAGLEILERDAIAAAQRSDGFFQRCRTSPNAHRGALAETLARVEAAGLACAFWQAPARHHLPVMWCHLMERGTAPELLPLPSEGFACDFTLRNAMLRSLLEAAQARATAMAGAREDINRLHYPAAHDRTAIAEWREEILAPRAWRSPDGTDRPEPAQDAQLGIVLEALRQAGAKAAIVVPLLADVRAGIHVARLLAPPLRLDPGA